MGSKYQPKRKNASSAGPVDPELEWENHVLLRVPAEFAGRVRAFCTDATPAEPLHVNFHPELRRGHLQVGRDTLHFTVYDLPCIVEVMKTLDNVNVYKVADLSQLLLCTKEPMAEPDFAATAPSADPAKLESVVKLKRERFFQYPHGLAPPLKNARKRRFRKTKKKKYMDAPEVEKEVKRLLRADLEAESVRFEVITVEQEKQQEAAENLKKQLAEETQTATTKPTTATVPTTVAATQPAPPKSQDQPAQQQPKPPPKPTTSTFDDEDSQVPPQQQVLPDDDEISSMDEEEDEEEANERLRHRLNRASLGAPLVPDEDTMDAPPAPLDDDLMNSVFGELSSSSSDDADNEEEQEEEEE